VPLTGTFPWIRRVSKAPPHKYRESAPFSLSSVPPSPRLDYSFAVSPSSPFFLQRRITASVLLKTAAIGGGLPLLTIYCVSRFFFFSSNSKIPSFKRFPVRQNLKAYFSFYLRLESAPDQHRPPLLETPGHLFLAIARIFPLGTPSFSPLAYKRISHPSLPFSPRKLTRTISLSLPQTCRRRRVFPLFPPKPPKQ